MRTIIIVLTSALLLSGCATSYQAKSFTGGFSETRLAPDVIRIVFRGNGYTSRERSQDFALLRAAELSLEAGYSYFVVVSEKNEVRTHTTTTPATARTTGIASTSGNQTIYSGQTTYDPGQTLTTYKPETGLVVQFMKEKRGSSFAFDAAFLVGSLKGKYKLE
jgi:hypothetical protein